MQQPSLSFRDLAQLVLLGAIWGSSFLFMRQAAPVLGAIPTTALRVALAAVLLLGVTVWRFRSLSLEHWRSYLFLGLVNIAIPFSLFAFAAKTLPSGYLSVLNATSPIFGAIFGVLLLHERLTRLRVIGLFLGFAGVAIMMLTGPVALAPEVFWALAAGLIAALCYGLAVIRLSQLVKVVPGLTVASMTLGVAAAALFAPGVILTDFATVDGEVLNGALIAAVTLGVLCTAVAYVVYFDLVTRVPPTRAIAVTFLIPVFATLWGSLILDESVTVTMALGGAVALVGTYLALGGRGVHRISVERGT